MDIHRHLSHLLSNAILPFCECYSTIKPDAKAYEALFSANSPESNKERSHFGGRLDHYYMSSCCIPHWEHQEVFEDGNGTSFSLSFDAYVSGCSFILSGVEANQDSISGNGLGCAQITCLGNKHGDEASRDKLVWIAYDDLIL